MISIIIVVAVKLDVTPEQPVPASEIITKTVYVEVPVTVESTAAKPFYGDINLSEDDIDLLAKIVYLEAGNQSITGQRAVVEVIFNRILDERFPCTLSEVIFAPGQFATVKNLSMAIPGEKEYSAIEDTLTETTPILSQDVVYFATYVANGTKYERIGDHYFCY